MVGLCRTEPSNVDGAFGRSPMHLISRNGSAHVTAGTELLGACSTRYFLCGCAGSLVEQLSRFQHCMHDHGELACHRDGGALEADALSQFEPPVS